MIKLTNLLLEHPDHICAKTGQCSDYRNPDHVLGVCSVFNIDSKKVWFAYSVKKRKIFSNVPEYEDKIEKYIEENKHFSYNDQAIAVATGNPVTHKGIRYLLNSIFRVNGGFVGADAKYSSSRLYSIGKSIVLTFWEDKNFVLTEKEIVKAMVTVMGYDYKKISYEVINLDGEFFSWDELFEGKKSNINRSEISADDIELLKQLHLNPTVKKMLLKLPSNRLEKAADKLNIPVIKLKQLIGRDISESLDEAPVDTYQTIGDFSKGASFRDKRDRALITHDIAIQKVKDFFKNTTTDFDFYFVNLKGRRSHAEKGKVDKEFLFKKYPEGLGLTPDQLKNGTINDNNVTVFFVGNSAAEKIPMTAWTIAHRFGHAIRRSHGFKVYTEWLDEKFDELLSLYNIKNSDQYGYSSDFYKNKAVVDKAKAKLFNQIGTMRSARQGEIDRHFEFYYELFAQYLKYGKITFNRLDSRIVKGSGSYGRKEMAHTNDKETVNDILQEIENDFKYYAEDALSDCIGNVYIM
jgi:hypothetical protein